MACEEQKVRHDTKSSAMTFCSSHATTSSVIYYNTEAQKITVIKQFKETRQKPRKHVAQVLYITPSDDVSCACVLYVVCGENNIYIFALIKYLSIITK